MVLEGRTQQGIAQELGITQPAVSQALRSGGGMSEHHVADVFAAAAPVIKEFAAARGFSKVAVFGSVARGDCRPDSDIDLLICVPPGTQIADLTRFQTDLNFLLGHRVDVITYGGLKPVVDDDIAREAVLL